MKKTLNKRTKVLLGMLVLTLGLSVGCGKSGSGTETDSSVVSKETANVSTDAKHEDASADISSWNFCSIDAKGTVRYPSEYSYRRDTGTVIYKGADNDYAILIVGGSDNTLSTETFNTVFDELLQYLGASQYRCFENSDLLGNVKPVATSREECKINGYDAFRFTGKTTGAENGKECYLYGYLSSTPKAPFAVYGVLTNDSQSDSLKQEMKSEVDMIMNTFETK